MTAIERKTVKQQQTTHSAATQIIHLKYMQVLKWGQKYGKKKQGAGSFSKRTDNRAPALPHKVQLGSVK